ncbi:MAG: six-hairpin glycosidase, partial [Bacteroides sp. SM23_62_1]
MHFIFKISSLIVLCIFCSAPAQTQDIIRYTGNTLCNIDYHHGQLSPVKGVHNIQVLRANREYPQMAEGHGWTYNHAPMMAYRNNTFYLEYLSDSAGEHIPPGQTLLVTSKDGYNWSRPIVLFPRYKIPDGTVKQGYPGIAQDLYAVMHQRMGFYLSKKNRLLALAFYGICMDKKDKPNDGKGIGRVVREIFTDGSLGPVYFIRYNASWNKDNTAFPFYKTSSDKGFVEACDELLANPLMMQQWNEEADRNDPLIPLKKQFKAFCYYHLPDGRVVGLWKHALTAISDDGGKTWSAPVRAPGFVNRNAKIWGQRTSDGRYITVYNPSEFRWPLAVSTSENGLDYNSLLLVHGEISPMRYGGNYKSYGPQYVRGILEGNGTPPDGYLWVTYSMNKEDIWVASIPVPVKDKEDEPVDDIFNRLPSGEELKQWNIYSPIWAPVQIEKIPDGTRYLSLKDYDRYDYAKAERLFPASKKLMAEFSVIPAQNDNGLLHVEFQDAKGTAAVRLIFDSDNTIKAKDSYRYDKIMDYKAGKQYDISIELDVDRRSYNINVNGKNEARDRIFFAPVASLERIVFRTGEVRRFPNPDTPAEQDYDLPQSGEPVKQATFYIKSLKISDYSGSKSPFLLNPDDFKHYIDLFNRMEEENIVQAVSNDQSWEWMRRNIPFFECPQNNFEEIYYFRWWTLRKHIKETPQGYAMTEFLVDRSYADKYNLISCALGHHIYEARWLHDRKYLDDYVHLWYRGNDGKNMNKLRNFSSWTADALYNRFLVDRDSSFIIDMLTDLDNDYMTWESMRRLPNGLFWQYDVSDGMEESISGGRHVKNARPTINSYMYGNAKALSKLAYMAGRDDLAEKYAARADTLKLLVQEK